jgi:ATP-binding cassette, subfamily B, multidrug efflux pump
VRLVSHLQRLPLSYYDQTPLGDVISRCTADVETVDTLFSTGVITLIANLVRLLAAAVAMVALSRPLTLIALLVIPPLVIITRWFQVRVRSAERRNRRAIGLLNTHLQEMLAGVEVIPAFGREATFVARFRMALQEALAAFNSAAVYSALYSPMMALLSASVIALLL